MRSKTALSLAEFCLALDGDPWQFAGIDRYGELKTPSEEVNITLEDAWMTKASANNATPAGSNSRSVVRKAIASAERRFAEVCHRYPVPTQTIAEHHLTDSYLRVQHKGFVVKPRYTPDIQFGVLEKTQSAGDIALVKLVEAAIVDEFTCEAPVPDDTLAGDVHVYLTATDGSYSAEPGLEAEIRPVQVVIDSSAGTGNWKATFTIPAYLCVKPSLYKNQKTALSHQSETYIDNVHIWIDSINLCQSGTFRGKKRASLLSSEDVQASLYDDGDGYFIAQPVTCQNDVFRSTILQNYPDSIFLNYVSGFVRDNGRVQEAVADVIWKLALGYLHFDEERNPATKQSPPLRTSKAQYYRQVQQVIKRRDVIGNQTATEYQMDVKPEIQYYLNGLDSRRGPIQAYGDILEYGWVSHTVNRTIK